MPATVGRIVTTPRSSNSTADVTDSVTSTAMSFAVSDPMPASLGRVGEDGSASSRRAVISGHWSTTASMVSHTTPSSATLSTSRQATAASTLLTPRPRSHVARGCSAHVNSRPSTTGRITELNDRIPATTTAPAATSAKNRQLTPPRRSIQSGGSQRLTGHAR